MEGFLGDQVLAMSVAGNVVRHGRTGSSRRKVWIVPSDDLSMSLPPGWAVDQAAADLYETADPAAVEARAMELVHESEQLDDERHDEYDDPDQGGEG